MKAFFRKIRDSIVKFVKWAWGKTVNFCKWVWNECKDWHTLVLLIIVVIIMYIPSWAGWLVWIIFKWHWAGAIATAYAAFWAGPFTPFFPMCIGITFGIKKLLEKHGIFFKKKESEEELKEDTEKGKEEEKKNQKKKKNKKAKAKNNSACADNEPKGKDLDD